MAQHVDRPPGVELLGEPGQEALPGDERRDAVQLGQARPLVGLGGLDEGEQLLLVDPGGGVAVLPVLWCWSRPSVPRTRSG
ncbi:MAG: hypothetical protein H0V33_03600 [Acidimicrobiia bacterium]|nr:hypothetical protein [Acidimicrobiia bacterium]